MLYPDLSRRMRRGVAHVRLVGVARRPRGKQTRSHPQWTATSFQIAVEHLPDKVLLLPDRLLPDAADHAAVDLDAEQTLEELALACSRLMDPCEHVSHVPLRIVRMELYRTGQSRRAASRERVQKERQQRRRPEVGQRREGFPVSPNGKAGRVSVRWDQGEPRLADERKERFPIAQPADCFPKDEPDLELGLADKLSELERAPPEDLLVAEFELLRGGRHDVEADKGGRQDMPERLKSAH